MAKSTEETVEDPKPASPSRAQLFKARLKFSKLQLALIILPLLLIGAILIYRSRAASYPVAALQTYTYWGLPTDSYAQLQWYFRPISTGSNQGDFWAGEFNFYDISGPRGNGGAAGSGYLGLQNLYEGVGGHTNSKVALFSVWGATGATSPGWTSSSVDGDPGRGTAILYNWQIGHTYRLRVVKGARDYSGSETGQHWLGYVEDNATGADTYVGDIWVPLAWGDLKNWVYNFSENYDSNGATTCNALQKAEVAITDVSGTIDGGATVAPSSIASNVANGSWLDANHYYACTNSYISGTPGGVIHHVAVAPNPAENLTYSMQATNLNGTTNSAFANKSVSFCDGKTTTTDSLGRFGLTIATGSTFCAQLSGVSISSYHVIFPKQVVVGSGAPATVVVKGQVTIDGAPAAGIKIETCTGHYPVTDSSGNWTLTLDVGAGFCARVSSGVRAGWQGPSTNNNGENTGSKTYEYQIAGVNCYHICAAPQRYWDLATDNNYNFHYTTAKSAGIVSSRTGNGYYVYQQDGRVIAFGDAVRYPNGGGHYDAYGLDPGHTIVGMASTGTGYWLVDNVGSIFAFGSAQYLHGLGDCSGCPHGPIHVSDIVGIQGHDTDGYWILGADGGVFAIGNATSYGSAAANRIAGHSFVGMAKSSTEHGYWEVDNTGNIYAYGDAQSELSLAQRDVHVTNIIGMTSQGAGSTSGYWLVGSDGGIYAFGSAAFYGSMGGVHLAAPIVGIARTPTPGGYWLIGSDGGIFSFRTALFFGRP